MKDVDILRLAERAPLRVVRWQDIEATGTNAARDLARLEERGGLTRIARGVFVAPPNGADGRTWKAPLEAGGLALATARFGHRRVALMGIGAARHWGAIPRALGATVVAIPVRGRPPVTLATGGVVHFVHRDVGKLKTVLERTALGNALVTTPAQTLYDLLAKPDTGEAAFAVDEAVRNIRTRVTRRDLDEIARGAQRVPAAVRAALNEWRDDEWEE